MVISTCFFTDEVAEDIAESCRLGRLAGAESVELRSRLYGKRVDELSTDELAALAGVLAAEGLHTAGIASSFGKCDLDDEAEWAEHVEILRGSIRAAQALGTGIVRVFPFWTPGRRELPRPGLEQYLDRIAARLRWAVTVAEREDVVLCFETEAATHAGTAAEVRRILDALGPSPSLGIAWDVNNAWFAGREHPLDEAYPLLRGLVRHLHVKPNAAGNIETVGDSDVSYAAVIATLIADGYRGAASIEHWGTPEQMLAGVSQLRGQLDALR
ncbi:MAG: sugar phosphate isomerase/epimerase family protein [Anaerolineae bacterium]